MHQCGCFVFFFSPIAAVTQSGCSSSLHLLRTQRPKILHLTNSSDYSLTFSPSPSLPPVFNQHVNKHKVIFFLKRRGEIRGSVAYLILWTRWWRSLSWWCSDVNYARVPLLPWSPRHDDSSVCLFALFLLHVRSLAPSPPNRSLLKMSDVQSHNVHEP